MARVYIGVDPSKGKEGVTISSSTTSKAVEVSIEKTAVAGSGQVAALLKHVAGKIEVGTWPPA